MMTSNLPAEALANPDLVPPMHAIKQTFWDCLLEAGRTFGRPATGWNYETVLWDKSYPMTSVNSDTQVIIYLTKGRSWIGYYF